MAQLSADEKTIIEMFQYMRPKGSVMEAAFIERYLEPLGFKRDAHLNWIKKVDETPVLWSAHVDTVHDREGMQKVRYKDGILSLPQSAIDAGSNCLGADDTAGIWLITEMVKAGVGGTYIIHHGEESGCIGSANKAKKDGEWLSQFRSAIAFDRAHKTDVITFQMGYRTASDAFARSLAAQLGPNYDPSPHGAYTDTNEYASVIPECTNISVGYSGQHSRNEIQDVIHLIYLRDKLVQIETDLLVIERDPSKAEHDFDGWGFGGNDGRSNTCGSDAQAMIDLIATYPSHVADFLMGMGISIHDLEDRIDESYAFTA